MTDVFRKSVSSEESKVVLKSESNLKGLSRSRTDKFGNVISKRLKNHKISFPDEVDKSKRLVDVNMVDSYKKYNRMDDACKNLFKISFK